jgi:hypothetical protein
MKWAGRHPPRSQGRFRTAGAALRISDAATLEKTRLESNKALPLSGKDRRAGLRRAAAGSRGRPRDSSTRAETESALLLLERQWQSEIGFGRLAAGLSKTLRSGGVLEAGRNSEVLPSPYVPRYLRDRTAPRRVPIDQVSVLLVTRVSRSRKNTTLPGSKRARISWRRSYGRHGAAVTRNLPRNDRTESIPMDRGHGASPRSLLPTFHRVLQVCRTFQVNRRLPIMRHWVFIRSLKGWCVQSTGLSLPWPVRPVNGAQHSKRRVQVYCTV